MVFAVTVNGKTNRNTVLEVEINGLAVARQSFSVSSPGSRTIHRRPPQKTQIRHIIPLIPFFCKHHITKYSCGTNSPSAAIYKNKGLAARIALTASPFGCFIN